MVSIERCFAIEQVLSENRAQLFAQPLKFQCVNEDLICARSVVIFSTHPGPLEFTYCGPPPVPDSLWTDWNFDPIVIIALLALAWMSRKSLAGQAAVAVLFLAFISPLCALSSALFSARVVHHILLVAVAAPLLAKVWPAKHKLQIAPAFVVSTVIFWSWHAPPLYELALSNVGIYWIMQMTLLGSAIWFWRAVLDRRGSAVETLYFIIAAVAQMGLLGAILTFAPVPLYEFHIGPSFNWGVTPLADQQLAGLIMWIPGNIPYAIVGIWLGRRGWTDMRDRFA